MKIVTACAVCLDFIRVTWWTWAGLNRRLLPWQLKQYWHVVVFLSPWLRPKTPKTSRNMACARLAALRQRTEDDSSPAYGIERRGYRVERYRRRRSFQKRLIPEARDLPIGRSWLQIWKMLRFPLSGSPQEPIHLIHLFILLK